MWHVIILSTLAFWISGSVILDAVVMPVLYTSGMMVEPGFATTGYSLFWVFNRIEILAAALVLTGILVLRSRADATTKPATWNVVVALGVLAIALIDAYILTPQMSAMGLQLNLFQLPEVVGMNLFHVGYWVLELGKLVGCAALLQGCFRLIQLPAGLGQSFSESV